MARPVRVHVYGGIYHVIMRGNAREPIFFDSDDRRQLNGIIAEGLDRYNCRIHAFCWMTNHIHAVVQVAERPLSEFMCWSASRYARFINRKRDRSGHLFERRHKVIVVNDDAYLLELVRYIHLNPVMAGIAVSPARYTWSSHRGYLGTQRTEWLTTTGVLSCFSSSVSTARKRYQEFMAQRHSWQPNEKVALCKDSDALLGSSELSLAPGKPIEKSVVEILIARLVAEYCSNHGLDPAVLLVLVGNAKRPGPGQISAIKQ